MAEFKEGAPTDRGRYAVELVRIASAGTPAAAGEEGKWAILIHHVVGDTIVATRSIFEGMDDKPFAEKALSLVTESRAFAFCLGTPFAWRSDAS